MLSHYQFAQSDDHGQFGIVALRREPGAEVVHLGALREPVVALATAARVCGHWLRQDTPDMTEVRALVAQMIEAADRAVAIVKR